MFKTFFLPRNLSHRDRKVLALKKGGFSGDDQQFSAVIEEGGAKIKAMIDTGTTASLISNKMGEMEWLEEPYRRWGSSA